MQLDIGAGALPPRLPHSKLLQLAFAGLEHIVLLAHQTHQLPALLVASLTKRAWAFAMTVLAATFVQLEAAAFPGYVQLATTAPPGTKVSFHVVSHRIFETIFAFLCCFQSPTDYPCPAGSFGARAGLASLSECTPCPAGKYCQTSGNSSWTGACSAGYFCLGNATSPTPTDGITGNLCQPGSYCVPPYVCLIKLFISFHCYPSSVTLSFVSFFIYRYTFPTPCPGGQYCELPGMATFTGPCQAGFYCKFGASQRNTTDGVTGNICPPGAFCPSGMLQLVIFFVFLVFACVCF